MLAYKFRLYPTGQQENLFAETLETCRRLYNSLLADRIANGSGFYTQKKKLVELKKDDKNLKVVHSQVLQDVVLRLDKAFQAFFIGIARYPRFKRAGRYNSFTYPQNRIGFTPQEGQIRLGMIGTVKVRMHRVVRGEIKTATIVKDIDQWFVVLSAKTTSPVDEINHLTEHSVGVDLGVSNIVALSDGTVLPNPRFLRKSEDHVRGLQKRLSRNSKGSNRREKTKTLLAKSWRRIRRQRDDFAHKLSDKLTKENKIIVFEDLNVRHMVKNHSLASAIMDSAWSKLRRLTVYKAEARGGRVMFVNPSGTSQKCSGCGEVVEKDLAERTHRCPRCGLILDRDVNAARNILKVGLEQALAESEPILIRPKRISKFSRGSEKPLVKTMGSSHHV